MIEVTFDASKLEAWLELASKVNLEALEAYLVNFVPYVPYLEYGWSKQAPHGMVRVSIPDIRKVYGEMMRGIDWDLAFHQGTLYQSVRERMNLTAMFAHDLIRDRTPIDTGRARRGWEVIEAQ